MAKTPNILFIFWRCMLGLALIAVGFKNYFELDSTHGFVSQNLKRYSDIFGIKGLLQLRKFSELIVLGLAGTIAYIGLFEFYGFGFTKKLALLVAIIDILLVHNPVFYSEPKYVSESMLNLGLLGAVLCN